jgi:hypothetical protein
MLHVPFQLRLKPIIPEKTPRFRKKREKTLVESPATPKDNQPTLHAEMQAAFAQAAMQPSTGQQVYTTEDNDHGRHERRTVRVLAAAPYLSAALLAVWPGLRTLVMVVRVVTCQTCLLYFD